ncbi:MAG: polyprenyl synthetase family protein [Candidatus Aenigmatarchaeota archaeon]
MAKYDIKQLLMEKAPMINSIIKKYIPEKYDKESMIFAAGKARYEYNIEAPNVAIAEPIWEFLNRGGKRWRPSLFLLILEALGGDVKKVSDYAIIPEVVHNGTLMIDDLEDSSLERRGKPCTYILYGTDIAVNAGNMMYYLPLLPLIKNVGNLPCETRLKIYNTYSQEMINLSLGQAMDIAWHKGMANADAVSEAEYLQMCAYKTGTLARMSAKIAAILSNANDDTVEKIGRFAEAIGVAFQIQDDILNLTSEEFASKKGGFGEDITEGKRTLMVIHMLKKASEPDRKRLIEILNMHTTDQKLRDEAIALLKKYGTIDYAKEYARKLLVEAWAETDKVLRPSEAKEKLRAFADYLVERKI